MVRRFNAEVFRWRGAQTSRRSSSRSSASWLGSRRPPVRDAAGIWTKFRRASRTRCPGLAAQDSLPVHCFCLHHTGFDGFLRMDFLLGQRSCRLTEEEKLAQTSHFNTSSKNKTRPTRLPSFSCAAFPHAAEGNVSPTSTSVHNGGCKPKLTPTTAWGGWSYTLTESLGKGALSLCSAAEHLT